MPRGGAFRSKAQLARLGMLEIAALPRLDLCRESARIAFPPPSFGNRPFTIPIDSTHRPVRICPYGRGFARAPVPP
jgi:hypothetical protein